MSLEASARLRHKFETTFSSTCAEGFVLKAVLLGLNETEIASIPQPQVDAVYRIVCPRAARPSVSVAEIRYRARPRTARGTFAPCPRQSRTIGHERGRL